jgi:hypothetical protein
MTSLVKAISSKASCPMGALILFLDKKDNKLRMCINYCALSKIMIKNNYFYPTLCFVGLTQWGKIL